ncbi:uncharacterized protein LACBIDRAFT_327278 [Laccaria bicolor S238N-H82]|uniref:Predicted protein n=1 Tax=Laccaria bicolor (strain S238N-H82 / ATCC MYA-4686) TaxID=486041 RepID=B0DBQ7_LACBS|nr:uncharacterized protein LACBIDRAFT_327278 [Laccaria bicolor S238N-H82]EDR08041.1 predicted protein [Laccaria bicolor S238N-H82]|eukprot:XP_001881111.1 predicted protein [Laccaria bicolor S238N-H82]
MPDPQKLIKEFEEDAAKEGVDLDADPYKGVLLRELVIEEDWSCHYELSVNLKHILGVGRCGEEKQRETFTLTNAAMSDEQSASYYEGHIKSTSELLNKVSKQVAFSSAGPPESAESQAYHHIATLLTQGSDDGGHAQNPSQTALQATIIETMFGYVMLLDTVMLKLVPGWKWLLCLAKFHMKHVMVPSISSSTSAQQCNGSKLLSQSIMLSRPQHRSTQPIVGSVTVSTGSWHISGCDKTPYYMGPAGRPESYDVPLVMVRP